MFKSSALVQTKTVPGGYRKERRKKRIKVILGITKRIKEKNRSYNSGVLVDRDMIMVSRGKGHGKLERIRPQSLRPHLHHRLVDRHDILEFEEVKLCDVIIHLIPAHEATQPEGLPVMQPVGAPELHRQLRPDLPLRHIQFFLRRPRLQLHQALEAIFQEFPGAGDPGEAGEVAPIGAIGGRIKLLEGLMGPREGGLVEVVEAPAAVEVVEGRAGEGGVGQAQRGGLVGGEEGEDHGENVGGKGFQGWSHFMTWGGGEKGEEWNGGES